MPSVSRACRRAFQEILGERLGFQFESENVRFTLHCEQAFRSLSPLRSDSAKTYENPARGTACWATDFSDPLGPESARDGRPKLAAHRIGLLPIVTHRASGVDCRTERLERPRAVPSGLFRWPRDLVSRTRRVQKWSIELVLTKISLCLANYCLEQSRSTRNQVRFTSRT